VFMFVVGGFSLDVPELCKDVQCHGAPEESVIRLSAGPNTSTAQKEKPRSLACQRLQPQSCVSQSSYVRDPTVCCVHEFAAGARRDTYYCGLQRRFLFTAAGSPVFVCQENSSTGRAQPTPPIAQASGPGLPSSL